MFRLVHLFTFFTNKQAAIKIIRKNRYEIEEGLKKWKYRKLKNYWMINQSKKWRRVIMM
ncbi:hypothetical protein KSS87_007491 [Heliosperma pusillum]|nr:hypothetical protein KSS87_007491 [Heliosperma pusillum]